MKRHHLLVASAIILALGAAPANALSVVQAPENADGSARFVDPDAAFDQQLDDYQNGRNSGSVMRLGDGGASGGFVARDRAAPYRSARDRRDHTCLDCTSVNVDGLWVLRPAADDGGEAQPAQ